MHLIILQTVCFTLIGENVAKKIRMITFEALLKQVGIMLHLDYLFGWDFYKKFGHDSTTSRCGQHSSQLEVCSKFKHHRLIKDSSHTHHQLIETSALDQHRLSTDSSQIQPRLIKYLRFITDSSQTQQKSHHTFITVSLQTYHAHYIIASTQTHHGFITDSIQVNHKLGIGQKILITCSLKSHQIHHGLIRDSTQTLYRFITY